MDEPITIQSALKLAKESLLKRSATPALDSQLLLGHLLGKSRAWLLTHDDFQISQEDIQALEHNLRRFDDGVALPHLLGYWEFFGRRFFLEEGVLIPRPETELVVEAALNRFASRNTHFRALDVGTGSGIIAISVTIENPHVSFLATDISRVALRVAQKNINYYQLDSRIHLLQCDLIDSVCAKFDLVCTNLPYLPHRRINELQLSSSEPVDALDGGEDGLQLISRMMDDLPRLLAPEAVVLLELDPSQGDHALQLTRNVLPSARGEVLQDLAGLDRLLVIEVGK